MKGWKKRFRANGNQKRAWVVIPISDKIDFKLKKGSKRQRGSLYNDKGVHSARGYNNFKYIHTNIRTPKCIKQMLTGLKEVIDNNTIIAGDFSTPLSTVDHPRKISKGTLDVNYTLDQWI